MKESTKAKIEAVKAKARQSYARIRETEEGRMVTDAGIVGASSAACAFAQGAYPDMSMDLGGISVPYTALAGAAAMALGKDKREVRAAGYGAVLSFVTITAYNAGQDWAAPAVHHD